jgi:BirA family biotin operon repressor/biotin-[acetyl-CoA-carboxylase] ligase
MSAAFEGPHIHLPTVGSTMDYARGLAERGAASGTMVTADEQTAGRGRHGRRWATPHGTALACSAILRPLDLEHNLLPLAVPIAVCEAAEEVAPVRCQVKWPNDVWLRGRKLAGVLIEARPPQWALIGIGMNLAIADDEFPDDLRWPATSLGHGVTTVDLVPALRRALGRWTQAPPAEIRAEFARRDALEGREVSWQGAGSVPDGSGRAAGIDEHGNLIVDASEGRVTLGAGEVQLTLSPDFQPTLPENGNQG